MNQKEKDFIFRVTFTCFRWMEMDEVEKIYNAIEKDVIKDIEECAHPEYWHAGDVRIAIQRVLFNKLGLTN